METQYLSSLSLQPSQVDFPASRAKTQANYVKKLLRQTASDRLSAKTPPSRLTQLSPAHPIRFDADHQSTQTRSSQTPQALAARSQATSLHCAPPSAPNQ